MKISRPSLLAQVLGVDAALIAATVLVATLMVHMGFVRPTAISVGFRLLTAPLLRPCASTDLSCGVASSRSSGSIVAMESVHLQKPGGRPVLPPGETARGRARAPRL